MAEIKIHPNSIEFPGKIYPDRYNNHPDRQNGHHFIVWENGNTANKALINTPIPDKTILDALEKIGANPGNNLSQKTWSERKNKDSDAPDQKVKGTAIKIYIQWDHKKIPIQEVFRNSSKKDIAIKVGGHRHLIPIWQSGCVTCMFSCPGGKTSNSVYTIRDQAYDNHSFWANESLLPADNTEVTVIMEINPNEE